MSDLWTCSDCTGVNEADATYCGFCGVVRATEKPDPGAWATRRLSEWRNAFKTVSRTIPPDHIGIDKWRQFLNNAARFINDGNCLKAIECGWDEWALFAFDPAAPLARLDRLGVCWFIQGEKVINVTESEIRISTKTGSLACRPREINPAWVRLPWDPVQDSPREATGTRYSDETVRGGATERKSAPRAVAPADALEELLRDEPQDRGMERRRRTTI